MKAMILAAGRGERMRPLSDTCPKPLLQAGPNRLIEYHIFALKKAGVSELVINTGWLADMIHQEIGDGADYGLRIRYSDEGYPALETAGGIVNALPLLGDEPFIVVNGDIFTDFDFSRLHLAPDDLGHLVLIPNPPHHPHGDFGLHGHRVTGNPERSWTFSGVALYRPSLFSGLAPGRRPLKPVLDEAIGNDRLSGEIHLGRWYDVGTPERLEELDQRLADHV
ncbi:MAG: nucleotidyltransferase family protein [Gammaproteobacteria bacterium]|nr:nucleotidyltransferase family protein [Gammaproteobacteria bacterium]